MQKLSIITQSGGAYIDSREVAELIGKEHCHLLRDIRRYAQIIEKSGLSKNGLSDFFVESSFVTAQNKTMPCYLLSKMGCEMVANKLTGEKGVLFTAAYVSRFNEMEKREAGQYADLADACLKAQHIAGRVLSAVFDAAYVPDKQKNDALRGIYDEMGIQLPLEAPTVRQTYPVSEITRRLGVLSLNGKPHTMAVSAIISMLHIADEHKLVLPYQNATFIGYNDCVINAVKDWLIKNDFPCEIECFGKIYRVRYKHRDNEMENTTLWPT